MMFNPVLQVRHSRRTKPEGNVSRDGFFLSSHCWHKRTWKSTFVSLIWEPHSSLPCGQPVCLLHLITVSKVHSWHLLTSASFGVLFLAKTFNRNYFSPFPSFCFPPSLPLSLLSSHSFASPFPPPTLRVLSAPLSSCLLPPSLSLLNHDCRPNCVMVFEGTKLQLRAVRDVAPEEEVGWRPE